jgi:hypothetical protein
MSLITKSPIVVLDNDECIGSWGDLSILYSLIKIVLDQEPSVDMFVDIINRTGCIRPGVKQLYHNLIQLRKDGIISGIYMCTAATNKFKWVTFLHKVLEAWYIDTIRLDSQIKQTIYESKEHSLYETSDAFDLASLSKTSDAFDLASLSKTSDAFDLASLSKTPIYDGVITQENIKQWHIDRASISKDSINFVKDMHMIRKIAGASLDTPVIMIDDRPENIRNGHTIGVTQYKVAVNLIEVAKIYIPEWTEHMELRYKHTFQENWSNYEKFPGMFTVAWMDKDIHECIPKIHKIVFSSPLVNEEEKA